MYSTVTANQQLISKLDMLACKVSIAYRISGKVAYIQSESERVIDAIERTSDRLSSFDYFAGTWLGK